MNTRGWNAGVQGACALCLDTLSVKNDPLITNIRGGIGKKDVIVSSRCRRFLFQRPLRRKSQPRKRRLSMKKLLVLAICLAFCLVGCSHHRSESNGSSEARHELFKTKNIYTFLLLDKSKGRVWQVQWGDKNSRMMTKIKRVVSN